MARHVLWWWIGWMSVFLGLRAEAFDHGHSSWRAILEGYVTTAGDVDYAGLKAQPQPLIDYLGDLYRVGSAEYRSWTKDQQVCFLLNLYNAQTIELVLRHYPLQSIKDIGTLFTGPWGQPVVGLFGLPTTLDFVGNQMLRGTFTRPEISMALCLAARSSPPLRREPYVPDRLDEQLRDQARRYLADGGRGAEYDPGVQRMVLSPLLKWNLADFGGTTDQLLAFVREYRPDVPTERPTSVTFGDFDWRLNDAATRGDQ